MSTNPKDVDWDYIYERNRKIWLGLEDPEEPVEDETNEVKKFSETMKGMPFLPKNLGAPKNVIPQWYAKRYKDIFFKSNDCFFTWNDGGKAHEMYHTSVFKCPVTGELFGSGKFGDNKDLYQERKESGENATDVDCDDEKVTIVWHRKKKDSEHAAAARALDCLSFREGEGVLSMCYGLCDEVPYLEGDETKFVLPSSVPSEFYDWLEKDPTLNEIEMCDEGNHSEMTEKVLDE